MRKFLIVIAALAVVAVSFTSCEDMLLPESDLVMYEEDNNLDSVNDTMYSVIGIVRLMQQVADKTNLLGEVRADLVTVTDAASTELREIATFTVGTENSYNAPQDYYAIINNCNFYIDNADTALKKRGQKVFEREFATMKTFRAWAYLQLAINYGEVPFSVHFLGTKIEAEALMKSEKWNLARICDYFIEDLKPYVDVEPLTYGSIDGHMSQQFFIPIRLMLGDLSLWSGRYTDAANYYHDYLNDNNNPRRTDTQRWAQWMNDEKPATTILSSSINEQLCYIPMEYSLFEGQISYLENIYCSTEENDFYYELTHSQALLRLSQSQKYYYVYEQDNVRDTVYVGQTPFEDPLVNGDLRLKSFVREANVVSSVSSKYNGFYRSVKKISSDEVSLYRIGQVYLRYAEALNRAGYPSAAFAVLKYGICNDNMRYIDANDIAAAGELIRFNQYAFTRDNTTGIHSRGCGDADSNPEYLLPQPADSLATYADTVAFQIPLVEDLICNEMALELCFEGTRFYDLMRIAMRRGDNDYLASRVAARNGADNIDSELYVRLSDSKNWYLPLK